MSDVATDKAARRKHLIAHLKHHWLTVSFFTGFLSDNITLYRVDKLYDIIVLMVYVLVAMITIWLLYASAAQKIGGRLDRFTKKYIEVIMQFAFGGLLSGMLIFYGRSGDWGQSWPFLLLIIGAIYGNESIYNRTHRFIYNISIFFIGMFAYVVLVVPVFIKVMGPWVFVGSGLLALLIMIGFLRVLYMIVPRFMSLHLRALIFTVGFIYVGFNVFYFTDLIPPIPLTLKEVGIYHSVVHFSDGSYQLQYEPSAWWNLSDRTSSIFHPNPGDDIYCYARVFAPNGLTTKIYQRWQKYDTQTKSWVTKARIGYSIIGGHGAGYPGYSLIAYYGPGRWRCEVETPQGQELGQTTFTVDSSTQPSLLATKIEDSKYGKNWRQIIWPW